MPSAILTLFWLAVHALIAPLVAPAEKPTLAPDLTLLMEGSKELSLSSFRGKWVLLLYGSTYFPRSEEMTLVGSHVREALASHPFEFIQIFDDPSACDGALFSTTLFAGIPATIDRKQLPDFFSDQNLPKWYLIDPEGMILASGCYETPANLRSILTKAWRGDPRMKGAAIAATATQAREEKLLQKIYRVDMQTIVDMSESILAKDPGNEVALRFLLHGLIRTKSYKEANMVLAEKTAGREITDVTRLYIDTCRFVESDDSKNRDALLAFSEKYPESKFVRCILLPMHKVPDELTSGDKELLRVAYRQPRGFDVKMFTGYTLQADGHPIKALRYFEEERGRGVMAEFALADCLEQLGRSAEARSLLAGRNGLTPENANPTEAWQQMHAATLMLDWATAAEYARAYQKLRPEKMQGLLVEWLASEYLGDQARAGELREESLSMTTSSNRYQKAASLLKAGAEPTVRDLTDLKDENIRFDTGLLFALLSLEKDRYFSLRRAQLASWVTEWDYAVFNKLRAIELDKQK